MKRKISRIGHSQGVLLPKEVLEPLGLNVGEELEVEVDRKGRKIVLKPAERRADLKGVDLEFASQVKEFIEKYRPALEALARK